LTDKVVNLGVVGGSGYEGEGGDMILASFGCDKMLLESSNKVGV
jgi:hypothetical protein